MQKCFLCPNACGVDRSVKTGRCGATDKIKIAKYYLHPFEEPCISGKKGSGTVFFCGCPLHCVFCQNYAVSNNLTGKEVSVEQLAEIFKYLEEVGAENINLVTPTQYVPEIAKAFEIYKPSVPVVYNSGGYEDLKTLEIANTFTDIYMPDMKFASDKLAMRYTGVKNYVGINREAVDFMIKSRKTRVIDGIMMQGVIVRHLILPLCTSDSLSVVEWFAKNGQDAFFSLMGQYTPFGNIDKYPELQRKITVREYKKVRDYLFSSGIENYYLQDLSSSGEQFIPKWDF